MLGPGNRIDLFLDTTLSPGARAAIMVDDLRGGELELGRFVYAAGEPVRAQPRPDPKPLPANPLPARMDFAGALKLDVPLDGGAMSMMMMQGMRGGREIPGHGIEPRNRIWTLANFSSSGHDGPPLFTVKRGRTVMLAFINRTAFAHAMHVHGHHFRLLDRLDDGWKPYWLDTTIVGVEKTERIAFVADNPGKWMIHCHMLEHQETGMAAWFEVA
jgi:FtsP/CotA-like multicopper oxidase with cupredoxin domain